MNPLSSNNKSKKKKAKAKEKTTKPKTTPVKQKGGCESCINLSSAQIKDLNATFGNNSR